MRLLMFRIVSSLLCVIAGALISMIELRFFHGTGFRSVYFYIILIVTVPTVFLYARSKTSVAIVFIYTLFLYFILEIMGDGVDIIILLACLFALVLLYAGAQFKQNADRSGTERPAYGLNFLTVLICVAIVAVSALQIYIHVLRPSLPESEKYAIIKSGAAPEEPEPSWEISAPTPPPVRETWDMQAAQGGGGEDVLPPRPPRGPIVLLIVTLAAAAAVCAFAAIVFYRYGKYRRWLKKTLTSPPEKQVYEFYLYFLRLLAVCGYPRRTHETPLEFLYHAETDGFPLPGERFSGITGAFAASHYGGKQITPDVREDCVSLFKSIPSLIKARKGRKFYYLRYIPRMTGGAN